jgi:cellulose synthase/poly-beta-1,6-N-acetylglucosamine synthase-like glycosyltransferase
MVLAALPEKLPGGAKAGNINNGLSLTQSPFVAIFDADHVPHRDFLTENNAIFADPKMGFVQSPQYYKNLTLIILPAELGISNHFSLEQSAKARID